MTNLFPFALGVLCTGLLLGPICFRLEVQNSILREELAELKDEVSDEEWHKTLRETKLI